MKFNFTEFVKSISFVLDLSEIDYFKINLNHSRRVAYISYIIGYNLNLDKDDMDDLFVLSLLHDNGVTISAVKTHKLLYEMMPQHCITGENVVNKLPLKKERKDVILYHHEAYNGTGLFKKHNEEIPLLSKIIYFADKLDTTFCFEKLNIFDRKTIKLFIEDNKNKLFDPIIVDAFLECFECERMWSDLKFYNKEKIIDRIAPEIIYEKSWNEIKNLSEVFIDIIDSKSKFTSNHTRGVAKNVEKLCKYYNFSEEKINKMIIAAYLHDIGKLYIPSEILDKPDSLDEFEFHEIKQHVYFTKLVLETIPGFEDITNWAANHHEKLNGKGYPECLTGDQLDFESRIMAICDIFQALTEDRPYRKGMSIDEAYKIMKNMADNGYIDKDIMNDMFKLQNMNIN